MGLLSSPIYTIRRFLFVSILFASIVSFNCIQTPLDPVAPTWDVTLTVPLVDTLRAIDEMIAKDTSIVQINPLSQFISYSDTKLAVLDSIGDRISLSPTGTSMNVTVGPIRVDSTTSSGSLTPFPPGTYPFFPAATVSSPSPPVPAAQNFTSLTFQSGVAELVITNNLPIPILFPDTIRLTDGLGRIVASFGAFAGELPPGISRTAIDNLAGRSTNNSIRVSTNPGRDSIKVQNPRDTTGVVFTNLSTLSFVIRFKNLVVTSATAQIPAQNLLRKDSTSFQMDSLSYLGSLDFKSGNFSIPITNGVNVGVTIKLRLPQLFRNGVVFDTTVTIAPASAVSVDFDLTRLSFSASPPTRFLLYSVEIAQLGSSGSQQTTVNASDSVVAAVSIPSNVPFIVKSGSAIIRPTPLTINQRLGIHLGDLPSIFRLDSIRIPDAQFTLNLRTPGFPVRIWGFRIITSKGTFVDSIHYLDNRIINLQPGMINGLSFDNSNSSVVNVINSFVAQQHTLPDSFRIIADSAFVRPDYVVGDSLNFGTIADTSKVQGDFVVNFPLNIGIKNGTVRDTVDIAGQFRISQNDLDHINSAHLGIQVRNSIPAGFQLSFTMIDSNGVVLRSFPQTGPLGVSAASVGANGFSSGTASSSLSLTANKQDVQALVEAKYLEVKIVLNTTPGQNSVKFRTSDSIRIGVNATINYRAGGS